MFSPCAFCNSSIFRRASFFSRMSAANFASSSRAPSVFSPASAGRPAFPRLRLSAGGECCFRVAQSGRKFVVLGRQPIAVLLDPLGLAGLLLAKPIGLRVPLAQGILDFPRLSARSASILEALSSSERSTAASWRSARRRISFSLTISWVRSFWLPSSARMRRLSSSM